MQARVDPGADLLALWKAALRAVEPRALVADFFAKNAIVRRPARRRGLFAVGKAAGAMATGASAAALDSSLLVVPRGTLVPRGWEGRAVFASHPEPGSDSVAAARMALDFFQSFEEGDEIFALLSGGASSLLCLPRTGLTLSEKRARIRAAMRAGWPIERLNRLRISLSAVKGGRLADASRARVITLVLSDVPGTDFRLVGSGPTVSARKKRDRAVLLGGNRTGLLAAARSARQTGMPVRVERGSLSGEAREAGAAFAWRLRAFAGSHAGGGILLAGGETTVTLSGRAGRGGRNQELALAAALEIAGDDRLTILCAGSDGIDGSSENAGAWVDGRTTARARGISPERSLARHDSGMFFELAGGAFRPGPTGTNVADWVFGQAAPRR